MKCLIVVFIVVAVAGYVKGNKELEAADKKYLLEEHNRVRAESGASNMYKLVWNSTLAAKMQKLVGTCKFEHTPDADRDWGENLGKFNFPSPEHMNSDMITATLKINSLLTPAFIGSRGWVQEKDYVTDTGFTCAWATGEQNCGNYTQMVWADSTQLGCAAVNCLDFLAAGGEDQEYVWFLACAYTTAGNVKNHKPFETGVKCTACKPCDKCEGNLCIAA